MSTSCLNPGNASVISLVSGSRKNFPMFRTDQIIALASIYNDKFNNIPSPEELLDFYATIQPRTPKEIFDETSVTEKEDIVDLLQGIFFKGLSKVTKGNYLTKAAITENKDKILNKIPGFLKSVGLDTIADNYDQYKEFLKSRLGRLNIDVDFDLEAIETQASKDNNWDKDSTFTDNYNRATDETVYLFASLTGEELIKGIPRPLPVHSTWNVVQNLLAGTSDINTQITILRRNLDKHPFINQILDKLGYGDFEELSELTYSSVRTSFTASFSKNINALIVSKAGKQSRNNVNFTTKLTIKEKWKSNFHSSPYSKIINNKRVFNPDKLEELLNEPDNQTFLNNLGIYLDSYEGVSTNVRAIKAYFLQKVKENNIYNWLDDKGELDSKGRPVNKNNAADSISSTLKDLLENQLRFIKETKATGARNANGEYQHSVGLHSYTSKILGNLRNKVIEAKNEFEKLFYDGVATMGITQGHEGYKENSTFDKLSPGDIYTAIIGDMFSANPFIHNPRTADKKEEKGIELSFDKFKNPTISAKDFYDTKMAYTKISPELYTRLFNQYRKDYVKKTNPKWGSETQKEPIAFWNELLKLNTLNPLSLNEFKAGIDTYIESQLEGLYADLVKNKVITYRKGKLNVTFPTSIIKEGNAPITKVEIDNMLKNYIFNSLMFGTELTQLQMGSLTSVSPEEFFKRNAGPGSAGKIPRTDVSMVNKLQAERGEEMKNFSSPAILKVSISKDDEVASTNAEVYNREGNTEAYSNNNVNDGQGDMIFQSYREYKIMLEEWSDPQEEAWKKMQKGEKLDEKRFNNLFPPIKPVGFSLVMIDGVAVPIYIKTSIYPIYPTFCKGTLNEVAYNKMLENGISINLPMSGIKIAKPKNSKDKFKNGEFVINEDAIFNFPTSDLLSQLDIQVKDSVKQLIATQQQKLIAVNMYNNGGVVDEDFKTWVEERTGTLEKLAEIETKKLEEKAGIEMQDGVPVINNYTKLAEMLREELLSRDMPLNTIDAINSIISPDGKLLNTIDTLPSRQKLMNLLNAIVTNKLIKLYTNGAALVQVAQTGWEMTKLPNGDNATDEEISAIDCAIDFINKDAKIAYYRNNGLGFLQLPNKGEIKTGAAEILLPAKFKKFVDADGKIDPRLITNIGYRIPTQGLNSILHLKVVGFLSPGLDQMVVMPREITTQGGSDFDVDKLNIFMPNSIKVKGKFVTTKEEIEINRAKELEKIVTDIFPNTKVKQVVYHSTASKTLKIEGFKKGKGVTSDALWFDYSKTSNYGENVIEAIVNVKNIFQPFGNSTKEYVNAKFGENTYSQIIDYLYNGELLPSNISKEAVDIVEFGGKEQSPDTESSQFIKRSTIKEYQKYGNFDAIDGQGYLGVFETEQIHILTQKELNKIDRINAKYDNQLETLEAYKSEVKYISKDMNAAEIFEDKKQGLKNTIEYFNQKIEKYYSKVDKAEKKGQEYISDELLEETLKNSEIGGDLEMLEITAILESKASTIEKYQKIYDDLSAYMTKEGREKWIGKFEKARLQNEMIEQTIKVLEHPNSVKSLLSPNNSDELKDLAKGLSKKIPLSSTFMPKTLADIAYQMFSAKALVGIFAAQSTQHALAQQVGLHFKSGRPFYFNHNKIMVDGVEQPSLAGVTTKTTFKIISDRLGNQYITASVDAAKDPFLFYLGCNLDTGGIFALVERLGGNIEYLVDLIKKPIIQQYLLDMSTNSQLSNGFQRSKKSIITNIIANMGGTVQDSEFLTDYYDNSEMGRARTEYLHELRETRKGDPTDIMMLDDYLYLADAASTVSQSISVIKFDTSGPGKDIIQSVLLNENYKAFNRQMSDNVRYTLATAKDGEQLPYSRIVTDTILDVFYKRSAKFVIPLYKDLVALNSNYEFSTILKQFNDPMSSYSNGKLDEESATLLYGTMINYVMQKRLGLNNRLFFGENTNARRVLEIQKDESHPLHDNYIMTDVFTPEIGTNTAFPDLLTMANKNIDIREQDYILRAFAEIKAVDPLLYEDLIKGNFYQTGVVQSPASYYNLLPNTDLMPIANSLLKNHQEITSGKASAIMDAVMANIGPKLNNIKKVSPKEEDVVSSRMTFTADRTAMKEYILYNKRVYKKVGDTNYELLDAQNYKSMFYNMDLSQNLDFEYQEDADTTDENPFIESEEDDLPPIQETIDVKSNNIYSQLGNKTKSENIVIKPWEELKNAVRAITPQKIVSTRIKNSNEHFGNPFSHDPAGKAQGLIKTNTIQEAVEKYIEWILNDNFYTEDFNGVIYNNIQPERRNWIKKQLQSEILKNKPILYYKELGEPSHATALDYLINKYDWNQPVQSQAPVIEAAPILNNKIEPGRYVRFNNETFIVTKININDTIQIYNPTLEGTAAKKSVAMRNLELLNNKAEIVKHKGSSYIVTPKETIISLTSNKAMNWGEENGDRKEILLKSKDKATTQYSAWNEISEENRKNLALIGYTEEMFNNETIEDQNKTLRCNG
jgi:hypothetical protein